MVRTEYYHIVLLWARWDQGKTLVGKRREEMSNPNKYRKIRYGEGR